MTKASPGRLRHRVGEFVAREGLWKPGERVAVAVSGGLDSMVLLDLLVEIQNWHCGVIEVVTVDHGTRRESGDDSRFVQSYSEERGLKCTCFVERLGSDASELDCREARYARFDSLDVDKIALAHHREDQAETVLLQLMRGAGTHGLGGMRPARGKYVRPLLEIPREELKRWAVWRQLSWREDPTNQSSKYLRNRVRAEVLPLLESIRPGATASLARAAESLSTDAEFLSELVSEEVNTFDFVEGVPLEKLQSLPTPVLRRVLGRLRPELSANHIFSLQAIVRSGRGSLMLDEFFRVEVLSGRLIVRNISK